MTWADFIISLNQDFGIEAKVYQEVLGVTVWKFEKINEELEYKTAFNLNEHVSETMLDTICEEMRIPKAFFKNLQN